MKAGRILLFACLFLWTGVSAWAMANPENRCSRVAAGAISNARYYDPELGRFIQADTLIPDLSNPQSYNRYSYVMNDPLRYNDPTGHGPDDLDDVPLTLGAAHAMLRQDAGGASANLYNRSGSELRATAAIGRGVAEMNPVVGGFNGGYGLIKGKDAMSGQQLTGWQRAKSGGEGLLAAAPLVFKLGKVANTAVKAEEALSAAKALETLKASKNGVYLGVIEKGEIRLFESAAGKFEGHSDLLKAGLVSKEAQGFSIGIENGKYTFMRAGSALNSPANHFNLSEQVLEQTRKTLGVPADKVIRN